MTLNDILQAVDKLSHEELRQLRGYVEQRERQSHPARGLTPEERIRRMRSAAAAIREGMTQEQLDEMFAAMNDKATK
jgi:hypothetical protein